MLGPLPPLYRVLVATTVLLLFAAGGAWAAFTLPYPVLIGAGAGVGLLVGVGASVALLHESRSVPETSRVRRRRLD